MHKRVIDTFRLLTFDATGTLINFRLNPDRQYVEVAKMHGLQLSPEAVKVAFKSNWKTMNTEHPCFGKKTGLHWKMWWYEVVFRTLKESVKPFKLECSKIDAIAHHLIDGYATGSFYIVYPHVQSTLQYLQERNVMLGIISNYDERLQVVLKELELDKYFMFILTSYETGLQKPSGEIFQLALQCGNNVLPQFAFHIGNSPELDYLAAKNCGWYAALIHQQDKSDVIKQYPEIPPHLIFNNFMELKDYLSN